MTPAEIKALEQQVLALDEQRCKVLVAKDGPGLATLIDAGLTYTHASGRRDTKESYVDSVATKRVQYLPADRPRRGDSARGGYISDCRGQS